MRKSVWYDPFSRRSFPASRYEDADGTPVTGEDEDGIWWGTNRAYWVIDPRGQLLELTGFLGPTPYHMYLRVESKEAALAVGAKRGLKEMQVD